MQILVFPVEKTREGDKQGSFTVVAGQKKIAAEVLVVVVVMEVVQVRQVKVKGGERRERKEGFFWMVKEEGDHVVGERARCIQDGGYCSNHVIAGCTD